MRLLRLTSTSDVGYFDNTFNQDIVVDQNSSLALQNISFEVDIASIVIDTDNDVITTQMKSGELKTAILNHGNYDNTNFLVLLKDITNKLNGVMTNQGKYLGSQWRAEINNDNKCEIGYRIARLSGFNGEWVLKNVIANATYVYDSILVAGTDGNTSNMQLGYDSCKGGSSFRCKINTMVDNGLGEQFNGYIIALVSNPNINDIKDADIKYGIQIGRITDTYNYWVNGVPTTTAQACSYTSAGSANNDITEIAISEGNVLMNIYNTTTTTSTPITLKSESYNGIDKLYPVIIFRGEAGRARVRLVKFTEDPYKAKAASEHNLDPIEAVSSPGQYLQPTYNYLEFESPVLSKYLGFNYSRDPRAVNTYYSAIQLNYVANNSFKGISQGDSFLVEMLNINLDSYDAYINQRANYLAVVPESDIDGEVIYAPPYPTWISLINKDKISLRNIRARILYSDRTAVDTKGLSTITILVDN